MKNWIMIIAVLWCTFSTAFAQTPKIVWGPEYTTEGGVNHLLGQDGEYFYTVQGDQEKPKLLKFDLTGKLVTSTPLNINPTKDPNEELIVHQVLDLKEHKYLILLARNKKMDQSNYYYAELKGGKLVLPAKKFHTAPFSFSYGTGLGAGPWCLDGAAMQGFAVSPNEKFIALFSTDFKNTGVRSFTVSVFDDKLAKMWQKDFPLEVKCEKIMMESAVVNNNGEVFTLAQEWEKSMHTSGMKFDFLVVKFAQSKMERFEIKLEGDHVGEQSLLTTNDAGGVVATGIYIKKGGKSHYLGFYYSYLDNGKMNTSIHPFPANVIALQYPTDKDNYLRNIYVEPDFVTHTDGGITYLVERVSINEIGATSACYEYIVPRFSATGQLMYVTTMNKTTKGYNNPAHGCSMIENNGAVTLIYNNEDAIGTKATGKDLVYTDICEVSTDGKAKIYNAFNSTALGKTFTPTYFLDLGNGKFLVKQTKAEFYNYGILTF